MKKYEGRKRILEIGIIPVVHTDSPDRAIEISRAICAGGIPIIEMTITVPGGIEVISELRRLMPDVLVGAGTVLDSTAAERCLDAGAQFVVSPGFNIATVGLVNDCNVLMIPGALTPTEAIHAWHYGCDFINVFPCGTPTYLKSLKTTLPHIRMIPSGGVNLSNAEEFFRAGAEAIGVRNELTSAESISETARKFSEIAKREKTTNS